MMFRREHRFRHYAMPNSIHNRNHEEFHRYYRNLRYLRPIALIFNLAILYWLFNGAGFKAISIIFALFIAVKETIQLLFLASNPNIVFTKDHIFGIIWGQECYGDIATVAVNI